MSKPTHLDDLLLGALGTALPAAPALDHAVRFLGTWSGTDKLLMSAQYSAKLLAPLLLLRARAQHRDRAFKRKSPDSPGAAALMLLASQLGIARRAMGLWGILAILKALAALERAPVASRVQLDLQRLQGLSMLVFYPLEYVAFFSAPWAPLLRISPRASARAGLWSVRAWGVYVALQIALLGAQWREVGERERVAEAGKEELADLRKKKEHLMYQLVANVSRFPVILHWSVVGGIYSNEYYSTILSWVSALASLRGGWESSRLPAPKR